MIAGLPLGEWEIRVELAGFRAHASAAASTSSSARPRSWTRPSTRARPTRRSPSPRRRRSSRRRSGELSYLVAEDTIRDLPLNGRNYTDLALLQPGVVAYPHRDGGSVVAHGLAMSINGQDPRSNVYLLDGTPLNDFTNGPAGSAASTALGTETIREFRVEANAYGAEFGRNSGGQIHAVTKSGTNERHGSGYLYHRNDALDARNYFDTGDKPDFTRYQFGGDLRRADPQGPHVLLRRRRGPARAAGAHGLHRGARRRRAPGHPARRRARSAVDPAVAPYLAAFPVANGANLGGGLAEHNFVFDQDLDQQFLQARLDQNVGAQDQLFVRYTYDDADQHLPTDFPQFPRTFLSTNQFLTAEYRHVSSPTTLHTRAAGLEPHAHRPGRGGEPRRAAARRSSPAASFMGGIDIGGIPGRFGPQTTANLRLDAGRLRRRVRRSSTPAAATS